MRIRSGISLPSAYQRVEYIQSSGTQFIEIPIGFERTDKVEFDFSMDTGQNTDKYMISPKTWNNNSNRFAMGVHSTRYTCGFGNVSTGSTYLSPITAPDGNRHQWIYENSVFTITDLNISYNGANNSFGGVTTNLKLFYGYNANTKGKVYSYKHWKLENEVLVLKMYLVPCKRLSNAVYGLYDIIGKTFYDNDGTGEFTAGSNKIDGPYNIGLKASNNASVKCGVRTTFLPPEYMQLDYIANANGGQYIDTGYIPSYSRGFKIEFQFTPTALGKRYCLLANYNQGNGQLSLEIATDNKVRLWLNTGALDKKLGTVSTTSINTVTFSYSGTTWKTELNGNSDTGTYNATSTPNYTMYMFLDRAKRTSTFPSPIKIYSCIIYDGDSKVRHFVPCKRRADSVLGMYDLVEKNFYANLGSGNFTQGNPNVIII